MTFLALRQYRYVCVECLHTFLERGKHDDNYCFKCGHGLIRIPGDD